MLAELVSTAGVVTGTGVGLLARAALRNLDRRRDEPPVPKTVKPRPVMHVPSGARR